MNSAPTSRSFPWRRFWLWTLAGALLTPILVVGGLALLVVNSLHVGPEVAALRDCVAPTIGTGWHKQVEVSVGRWPLFLARAGLRFAPVQPEAKLALAAAQGADVVVYEHQAQAKPIDRGALLQRADEAMSYHDMHRTVGVIEKDQFVLVYVPNDLDSPRDFTACVMVLDHENLVVVSGRANLEPLLELVRSRPQWHDHLRLTSPGETALKLRHPQAGANGI